MATLTNTNKSFVGGDDMRLTSFILEAIKEGCDTVRIRNYTKEEWKNFLEYIRIHRVRCAYLNKEYMQENLICLSERAIKLHFDIMLDRPYDTPSWKDITETYEGDYDWNVPYEEFIKARNNMVRGCGTIVHTTK